jgi:hypothetical protein
MVIKKLPDTLNSRFLVNWRDDWFMAQLFSRDDTPARCWIQGANDPRLPGLAFERKGGADRHSYKSFESDPGFRYFMDLKYKGHIVGLNSIHPDAMTREAYVSASPYDDPPPEVEKWEYRPRESYDRYIHIDELEMLEVSPPDWNDLSAMYALIGSQGMWLRDCGDHWLARMQNQPASGFPHAVKQTGKCEWQACIPRSINNLVFCGGQRIRWDGWVFQWNATLDGVRLQTRGSDGRHLIVNFYRCDAPPEYLQGFQRVGRAHYQGYLPLDAPLLWDAPHFFGYYSGYRIVKSFYTPMETPDRPFHISFSDSKPIPEGVLPDQKTRNRPEYGTYEAMGRISLDDPKLHIVFKSWQPKVAGDKRGTSY